MVFLVPAAHTAGLHSGVRILKDARENLSSGLFKAYRRRGPGPAEQELIAAGSARSGFITPTQVIWLLSVGIPEAARSRKIIGK